MNKKKQPKTISKFSKISKDEGRMKPALYLIVMGYLFIPVITPDFYTLDSVGPKFLSIAMINLISFLILLTDRGLSQQTAGYFRFFRSYAGIAYSIFILFSVASFLNAINLNESVLNFVKVFTVFNATYVLFMIFSSDHRYFYHLAIALTILLLIDSFTVFYNILLYVAGEVTSIMNIRSVYGHKNILASALFIKLPAAIFLSFYLRGWRQYLGYAAVFCAVLSTLLLSTRAFYIGLVLLLLALLIFVVTRHMVMKKKGGLLTILRWAGIFLVAVILYASAQHFLFPKNRDTIWNTGIISRMSSISKDESSTHARLGAWSRSVNLIGEHPLIGVGTGNWKVQSLKEENLLRGDFVYMNKAHNDFLEVTAETGLPGGLAYLSIFLLILYGFARETLNPLTERDRLKLIFLPAFGLLAYMVDAFFNFPADRPEIQSVFAMYVAAGAAFAGVRFFVKVKEPENRAGKTKSYKRLTEKVLALVVFCFLCFAIYILFFYSRSLYFQRIVEEEMEGGDVRHTAASMIEGFPSIPDISTDGEPIAVNKARYLFKEKRFDDAIAVLKADHASPYDTRREYFLAGAYQQKGVNDSAIWYLRRVHLQKPLYPDATILLGFLLFSNNRQQEAMNIMDRFAIQVKTNSNAWLRAANMHWQIGSPAKAIILLDSALKYLPGDSELINMRSRILSANK